MVTWLKRQLYQARLRNVVVQKECNLGDMGKNQLWLTERKQADIVLKGSRVFVQLEVQSAHQRDASVRKLSFGLIDQLRYLKNRGVDSNEVAGFYVPVVKGYVEKITCVWEDANLCYVISAQLLRQQEVFTTIRDVYVTQSACQLGQTISNFTLPLSQAFVHETWGDSAYQLSSIVIIEPRKKEVFKNPLNWREKGRLDFFLKGSFNNLSLTHASFPTGVVTITTYFTFPALAPPLSRTEAKQTIIPFVELVVCAVQELHATTIAHRDIRLENICFNPSTGNAVLIDLDRSCDKNEAANILD